MYVSIFSIFMATGKVAFIPIADMNAYRKSYLLSLNWLIMPVDDGYKSIISETR